MLNNNRYIKIILITILGIINLSATTCTLADTDESVGFYIQAILPDNQINKNSTYFDLKMEPGQEQTIKLLITNSSDTDEQFEISINQAYTNNQGFIDYAEKDVKLDKSLPYSINDITSYEKTVSLKAKETIEYPIKIKMPKDSFDGQILSGIQVIKKNKENKDNTITNQVGYILSLSLKETDTEIKRELELIDVTPKVTFGTTSVVATLRNPTSTAYGNLKYVVNITDSANKNVRSVTYDSGMQFAPNSTYGLAIDWQGEKLIPGEYTLDLKVSDAKDNVWTFKKFFTIDSKEAVTINKVIIDSDGKDNNNNLSIILFFIALSILLIIAIIFLYKKLKKSQRKKSKKSKKSKKKI